MGSCCKPAAGSTKVDDTLKKDRAKDREIKKLLLLGAGSSGKSTFFKQLKRIHGDGFSSKDRRDYAAQIESQIISQMQKLIIRSRELIEDYGIEKYGNLELQSDNARESASFIDLLGSSVEINDNVCAHIRTLWQDPGILNAYSMRGVLSIPDSCKYFFDEIDRIASVNYSPSDDDILLVRKRTTGIIEEHFLISQTKFHIFDVGGQRNERKKWIHCFDGVCAVIFVASLSSYNEVLLEDESIIAMLEELNLFEQISNSRWFQDTAFILFLNKRDLFEIKFGKDHIPLTNCFEKFDGSFEDIEYAHSFIKKQYLERNHHETKQIYCHITCATDQENVLHVFNDVQQIVVQTSLRVGGLI